MRILVIEDDKDIGEFLEASLKSELYSVDLANDGETGSFMARTNEYDLIILDYALPKKDGKEVCKEIREAGKSVPIIMLTVQSELPDKIEMLNLGADDYMTKPFSFDELLARSRAVMRRPKQIQSDILQLDDLKVDSIRYRVYLGEK